MSMRYFINVVVLVLSLVSTEPAGACPFCETATGKQVREKIVEDDFCLTIATIASPFIILGLGLVIYARNARSDK